MDDVVEYLLSGDPAIRWQVMRDLTGAPPEAVAAERARVATEGWGARLLGAQAGDGRWDGGTYRPGWVHEDRPFFDAWTATHFCLQSLMEYGVDPASPQANAAVRRVAENVRWDYNGALYFSGEAEPCINGVALAVGAYFGQDAASIAETLLATQHTDGGWNCWDDDPATPGSFHSTICALEGLFGWEQALGAATGHAEIAATRHRGEEYLLDRRLLHRLSTGEVIDPRFAMPASAVRWYYDVLRALDYFRLARPDGDPRCADAIDVLRGKMLPNGMWCSENEHEGSTLFALDDEGEGFPSRWVTLRARRVLKWWDAAVA